MPDLTRFRDCKLGGTIWAEEELQLAVPGLAFGTWTKVKSFNVSLATRHAYVKPLMGGFYYLGKLSKLYCTDTIHATHL